MQKAILVGIAIGLIVYQMGFVIPWLISNKILPIELDILLIISDYLITIFIIYKFLDNYKCFKFLKKKRKKKDK